MQCFEVDGCLLHTHSSLLNFSNSTTNAARCDSFTLSFSFLVMCGLQTTIHVPYLLNAHGDGGYRLPTLHKKG